MGFELRSMYNACVFIAEFLKQVQFIKTFGKKAKSNHERREICYEETPFQ